MEGKLPFIGVSLDFHRVCYGTWNFLLGSPIFLIEDQVGRLFGCWCLQHRMRSAYLVWGLLPPLVLFVRRYILVLAASMFIVFSGAKNFFSKLDGCLLFMRITLTVHLVPLTQWIILFSPLLFSEYFVRCLHLGCFGGSWKAKFCLHTLMWLYFNIF